MYINKLHTSLAPISSSPTPLFQHHLVRMSDSKSIDILDSIFDSPQDARNVTEATSSQKSESGNTHNTPPLRFDPFADPTPSAVFATTSHSPSKPIPPQIKTDLKGIDRDDGNFAIFSPAKAKPKSLKINATSVGGFDLAGQGMVLGRVSTRSLLMPGMRDWTPFFYVIMENCDIRYYEDPNFLKNNRPDDYSILIYRER